jgi:hypothetical protein
MAASERDTTTKVLTRLDADVEAKKSELARLQSGWCEDRWTTIKISQEIGALPKGAYNAFTTAAPIKNC